MNNDDVQLWDQVAATLNLNRGSAETLMVEEEATRHIRIQRAFERGAKTSFSGDDRQIFDKMWLGQELSSLNENLHNDLAAELSELLAEEEDKSIHLKYAHYHLMRTTRLIAFYYTFGSKSKIDTIRLEERTEKLLLKVLWERTKYKNDIAVTKNSTWWMTGSENHDLNTKVCNLITSRIFMDEKEYKDKVYPNLGYGDGIGYGEAGDSSRPEALHHHAGRADLADGKSYTAKQHYQAWHRYFMDYFAQRARKGFFVENGACGYMKWTICFILTLHNFCGDADLKNRVGNFLDLIWADWAVQELGGVRGGPKTRHHYIVGGYDSMTELARFYAGGDGKTTMIYVQQLISDYQWPKLIWELVFDQEDQKPYEYISRGIGEENTRFPRPKGVERTMMCDTPSRLVKYSYVTPDYILGTQMDHPNAVYNHLATTGRWQGLITGNPDVRLCTVSLDPVPEEKKSDLSHSMELVYHSVQHKDVLITQQKRQWSQINPDWFPAYKERFYERPFGLYIGSQWDRVIERDGWIFIVSHNTYVAIRVLQLEVDPDPLAWAKGTDKYLNQIVLRLDSYSWNEENTVVQLNNKFSPIIIEAGREADYGSFEHFMDRILGNDLKLYKTVVTGEAGFILAYKGCGCEAKEIVFNGANKDDAITVGGVYIDYEYPKVFDCPWIRSDYDSGMVYLKSSKSELLLDFSE